LEQNRSKITPCTVFCRNYFSLLIGNILDSNELFQTKRKGYESYFIACPFCWRILSINNIFFVEWFERKKKRKFLKETGVFQTYSIAFSRFSNFHHEFSNFPIAFCNVFSKINLIENFSFSEENQQRDVKSKDK
jgi:hypothetical protein